MKRTAMELAALASAAMPGLDIVQATASPDDPRSFDSAIVTDSDNNHWRVRSPKNSQAAFRLETEIQVLSGFTPAIRAHLPFRAPSVAGAVQLDGLRTFIYHQMPGHPIDLDTITQAESQTIDDIGRIIAAIHKLPSSVVETADLPAYGAEELRARLLSELDQMALTGMVPAELLRRWENAFEERGMWTFIPRVVHGDFDETSLLIDRNRAVGVTAWTDLHIGDPARDFMWLASTESLEFREALISAYHRHMAVPADHLDLHILRRAALAAEFSLAKYLMTGVQASDDEVIAEAQVMLQELAEDIATTGGQDIGQHFWEPGHDPRSSVGPDGTTIQDAEASEIVLTDAEHFDESSTPVAATDTTSAPDTADPAQAAAETPAVCDTGSSSAATNAPAESEPAVEPTTEDVEEGAELVVHSLSDEGELIAHEQSDEAAEPETNEDDDTQPISWQAVRENLPKD